MNFLGDYLETYNWFRDVPVTVETMTQDQYTAVLENLDCKCSPENLHQDGERSPAEVARWSEYYRKVYEQLTALGDLKGFIQPELYEVIDI